MKKLRVLVVALAIAGLAGLMNCGDDADGICAGCDNPDEPWSRYGSDQCYANKDDCEAVERGTCTICS